MENSIIIICSIFAIIASIVTFISSYVNSRAIKKRLKESEIRAVLSFQREKQESLIYEAQSKLLSSPIRFSESNHLFLAVDSDSKVSKKTRNDSFYESLGLNADNIVVEPSSAICLMPFHKIYNKEYDTIKQACKLAGINCRRSDEEFVTGNILRYTVELILKSQIVIAVLDGKNANVTYEVGIANALGKPVILVANLKTKGQLPFDLQSDRFILYSNWNELNMKLSQSLSKLANDSRG